MASESYIISDLGHITIKFLKLKLILLSQIYVVTFNSS